MLPAVKCSQRYAKEGYDPDFIAQFETFRINGISEMYCPDLSNQND